MGGGGFLALTLYYFNCSIDTGASFQLSNLLTDTLYYCTSMLTIAEQVVRY